MEDEPLIDKPADYNDDRWMETEVNFFRPETFPPYNNPKDESELT